MSNWKDMCNRDKDAFGAERVMGWKWIVYSVDLGKTARIIKPPDKDGFHNHPEEFWDGITEMPVNTIHLDRFCPSTNASDDYEILEKVRVTWTWKRIQNLVFHLSMITFDRGAGLIIDDGEAVIFYEPSDYLKAAFMAMNGE